MNILDTLPPDRYVDELPDLIEVLAIEFPQIKLHIAPANLALVVSDLQAGLCERNDAGKLAPAMAALVAQAREENPVELYLGSQAARSFARDLARGTALRKARGPKIDSEKTA